MKETAPGFPARCGAAFCHVSGVFGLWIVGPIVVYLIQRDRSAFVAKHALLALFYQLFAALGLVLAFAVIWLLFTYVFTSVPSGNLGLGRLPDLIIAGVVGFGPIVLLYGVATLVGTIQSFAGMDASGPLGGLIRAVHRRP